MHSRLMTIARATIMLVAVAFAGNLANAQNSDAQQPSDDPQAGESDADPRAIDKLRRGEDLAPILEEASEINQFAQASQERIDDMASETQRLLREYQAVLREIESLKAYNAQQRAVVRDQEQQISELQQSIDEVVAVRREITPLMMRMIDALEQFIDLDMPFLLEDRRERVENLRDFMDASDISPSEKFRLVLEAYQRESEFGRTIETYRSTVEIDGQDRQVNILRVGRAVLAYRTLDGEQQGFWNKRTEQWEPLGDEFGGEISRAMSFANDQAAPNMYLLPVPGPTTAQAQE